MDVADIARVNPTDGSKTLTSSALNALRNLNEIFLGAEHKALAQARKENPDLRRIKIVQINPTDGSKTLASSGVFTGGIHGERLPSFGRATQLAFAGIHPAVNQDGNGYRPADMFEVLGPKEKRRRWEQEQVVEFCRNFLGILMEGAAMFELECGLALRVHYGFNVVHKDAKKDGLIRNVDRDVDVKEGGLLFARAWDISDKACLAVQRDDSGKVCVGPRKVRLGLAPRPPVKYFVSLL